MLIHLSNTHEIFSYEDLAELAFSKSAAILILALQLAFLTGDISLSYCEASHVILRTLPDEFIQDYMPTSKVYSHQTLVILFLSCLTLPTAKNKRLQRFEKAAYFSAVAFGILGLCFWGDVAADVLPPNSTINSPSGSLDADGNVFLPEESNLGRMYTTLPSLTYPLGTFSTVLTFYNSLRRRDVDRGCRFVLWSITSLGLMCFVVGGGGWAGYVHYSEGNSSDDSEKVRDYHINVFSTTSSCDTGINSSCLGLKIAEVSFLFFVLFKLPLQLLLAGNLLRRLLKKIISRSYRSLNLAGRMNNPNHISSNNSLSLNTSALAQRACCCCKVGDFDEEEDYVGNYSGGTNSARSSVGGGGSSGGGFEGQVNGSPVNKSNLIGTKRAIVGRMWNGDGDLTVTFQDESNIINLSNTQSELSVSLVDNEHVNQVNLTEHAPPTIENQEIIRLSQQQQQQIHNPSTSHSLTLSPRLGVGTKRERKSHLPTTLTIWLLSLLISLPSHSSSYIVVYLSPISPILSLVVPSLMYFRLGPVDADFGSVPVCGDKVWNFLLSLLVLGFGLACTVGNVATIARGMK